MQSLLEESGNTHHAPDKTVNDNTLLPYSVHESGKQFVEKQRNCKEHCHLAHLEFLENLRNDESLAEYTGGTAGNSLKENSQHGICMMQGKNRIEYIFRVKLHEELCLIAVRHKVLMRELNTLRSAGCSGCEENCRNIIFHCLLCSEFSLGTEAEKIRIVLVSFLK